MHREGRAWLALTAACGFLGVAAGAFAAHGMTDAAARELVRTGSTYQLVHALAALACEALARQGMPLARLAMGLFLLGALLFSGSLYALAFGGPRLIGAVTPIGGLSFLAGWVVLFIAGLQALRPRVE
jgi:uncharacterized membrane protein YgdD (TMEM256/DUF423 family)